MFVLGSFAAGRADVYDLYVEDVHEFVAQGVVVHNCVWALTDLLETPPPRRGARVNFYPRTQA